MNSPTSISTSTLVYPVSDEKRHIFPSAPISPSIRSVLSNSRSDLFCSHTMGPDNLKSNLCTGTSIVKGVVSVLSLDLTNDINWITSRA